MTVHIETVRQRRDLRRFIHLPFRLHRGRAGWVPPLLSDEWRLFTPRRNPAYRYCDASLWLARNTHGMPVGRIAGIINRRYNALRGECSARFTHFDCPEDIEVAEALLDRVKQWARDRGMNRVIGPMGFTDQDPEGFVVEGFDEEPSIATYHNREYVIRLLDRLGWTSVSDYVVYKIPVPDEIPAFYERIHRRIMSRGAFRLIEFERRSELRRFIRPILELMNATFVENVGYAPMDEREMDDLARRYLPVIDPRFVKVVAQDAEVIGFIIALPNIVAGIRRARGRLLPLGWLWILRAAKRAQRLDLLLGGIKEDCRGRGVDVLLGRAMTASALRAGFAYMDSHHELESNTRVRAEMERMGGRVYKRYRVFGTDV